MRSRSQASFAADIGGALSAIARPISIASRGSGRLVPRAVRPGGSAAASGGGAPQTIRRRSEISSGVAGGGADATSWSTYRCAARGSSEGIPGLRRRRTGSGSNSFTSRRSHEPRLRRLTSDTRRALVLLPKSTTSQGASGQLVLGGSRPDRIGLRTARCSSVSGGMAWVIDPASSARSSAVRTRGMLGRRSVRPPSHRAPLGQPTSDTGSVAAYRRKDGRVMPCPGTRSRRTAAVLSQKTVRFLW
jgi:hypothetical protein